MPTKAEERILYAPGNLVLAAKDIYMAGESTAPEPNEPLVVPRGTIGLVMEAGLHSEPPGFNGTLTLRVQFLCGHTWWVSPAEILPHLEENLNV
tara:strand:- start:2302 stop:2583 length:282 start_codon:yes stop_codon:yes gene_type:complete